MPRTKASANKAPDNNGKTIDKVVEIIQFMGDNHLAEIELETSELKMKLKKYAHQANIPVVASVKPLIQADNTLKSKNSAQLRAEKDADKVKEAEVDENFNKLNSPMAGTFYRAPSPSSPPFVSEGDNITIGQTICIIEAMKMMNEIKADQTGKIIKILLENGQPVDKGTVLFHIGE